MEAKTTWIKKDLGPSLGDGMRVVVEISSAPIERLHVAVRIKWK